MDPVGVRLFGDAAGELVVVDEQSYPDRIHVTADIEQFSQAADG